MMQNGRGEYVREYVRGGCVEVLRLVSSRFIVRPQLFTREVISSPLALIQELTWIVFNSEGF